MLRRIGLVFGLAESIVLAAKKTELNINSVIYLKKLGVLERISMKQISPLTIMCVALLCVSCLIVSKKPDHDLQVIEGILESSGNVEVQATDLIEIRNNRIISVSMTYSAGETSNLKQPLQRFPIELMQLDSLKRLDLSGNEIDEVDSTIFRLSALKYLNVSKNKLIAFPTLREVKWDTLLLQNNKLSNFETFFSIDHLGYRFLRRIDHLVKYYNLDSNQICDVYQPHGSKSLPFYSSQNCPYWVDSSRAIRFDIRSKSVVSNIRCKDGGYLSQIKKGTTRFEFGCLGKRLVTIEVSLDSTVVHAFYEGFKANDSMQALNQAVLIKSLDDMQTVYEIEITNPNVVGLLEMNMYGIAFPNYHLDTELLSNVFIKTESSEINRALLNQLYPFQSKEPDVYNSKFNSTQIVVVHHGGGCLGCVYYTSILEVSNEAFIPLYELSMYVDD